MKLIRFGPPGKEKPGLVLENERRIDVSAFVDDYDEAFFGGDGIRRLRDWLLHESGHFIYVSDRERLGPPVARPSKLICIGLNYRDHARESGAEEPTEPVIFFKATSAIVGPNDNVVIPRDGHKLDWEVELAFVIGAKASNVERTFAKAHVAGYVLHNDYSERAFQLEHGGQWVKGKSCDTFAPLGPYLVTKDEIRDVNNLDMWLRVNGQLKQKSNSKHMIFDIPALVAYVSRFMTLLPGDIISTGTPAGVGLGFDPPQYLHDGDNVELGMDGLGISHQKVTAF